MSNVTRAPFKLGIISATGTARKRTLPALVESAEVFVSAIHGRDSSTLEDVRRQFGVPRTAATVEELVGFGDLDGVMICSPPFLHLEQAEKVLAAGLPLLLEKPAAIRMQDFDRMNEIAIRESLVVRVAHHLRHQGAWNTICQWLRRREIGDVVAVDAQWIFCMNRYAPSSVWKLDPDLNGSSCLTDAGVHCIDALLGLFGPAQPLGSHLTLMSGDRTYESADLLLAHGDATAHVRASRLFGPFENHLTIYGADGYIRATDFFTERSSETLELHLNGRPVVRVEATDRVSYRNEVEDFARVVRGNTPRFGETTLEEARQAQVVIDFAVQQADLGGKIGPMAT